MDILILTSISTFVNILFKNNIRMKLGTSLIKSTWFTVEYDENTNEYVFYGKGFGHGVGMSQHGAMGMAEAGFNYQEILEWYYNDIVFEPNGDQYIIVDEENENNNAIDKDTNKVDNKYVGSKVEINCDNIETKKGPMLEKILTAIENLNSWR